MRLQQLQEQIRELLTSFVLQVKASAAMNQTDINRVAETFLVSLLSEVLDLRNLRNLNVTTAKNYPGIDLADDIARVAIQVTSTPTLEKVKDCLETFLDYHLQTKYDRVIIYVISEKQRSYSQESLSSILGTAFAFDVERDILDYRELLRMIGGFQADQLERILHILQSNVGAARAPTSHVAKQQPAIGVEGVETVYLNLLELTFPEQLYVAQINLHDSATIQTPPHQRNHRRRSRRTPWRDQVTQALSKAGLKFSVDWEYYERKIVTFHDLGDRNLPLSTVIDPGTVDSISPDEFYGVDENQERVFKSLLRRCLQQKLYHRQVMWQNEKDLFIFCPTTNDNVRLESWQGDKNNERTVFERTLKTDEPDKTWYCRHFGFATQFVRIGAQWYVTIKPDWFFSFDGYRSYRWDADKITWLKKKENNAHVFNHLRFITYFLTHEELPTLFNTPRTYPFLQFGGLTSFPNAPILHDSDWNPGETVTTDPDQEQMPLL